MGGFFREGNKWPSAMRVPDHTGWGLGKQNPPDRQGDKITFLQTKCRKPKFKQRSDHITVTLHSDWIDITGNSLAIWHSSPPAFNLQCGRIAAGVHLVRTEMQEKKCDFCGGAPVSQQRPFTDWSISDGLWTRSFASSFMKRILSMRAFGTKTEAPKFWETPFGQIGRASCRERV